MWTKLARLLRIDTTKKLSAAVGVCGFALVFVRVVVLLCEAYSAVRSERASDGDLLKLCDEGAASQSVRFRNTCMQARAEMASPILFKAILRALKTCYTDFAEMLGSPSKWSVAFLFVLSWFGPSLLKILVVSLAGHVERRRRRRDDDSDEDDEEGGEVVFLNGARARDDRWQRVRHRLTFRKQPVHSAYSNEHEFTSISTD